MVLPFTSIFFVARFHIPNKNIFGIDETQDGLTIGVFLQTNYSLSRTAEKMATPSTVVRCSETLVIRLALPVIFATNRANELFCVGKETSRVGSVPPNKDQ